MMNKLFKNKEKPDISKNEKDKELSFFKTLYSFVYLNSLLKVPIKINVFQNERERDCFLGWVFMKLVTVQGFLLFKIMKFAATAPPHCRKHP